MSLLTQASLILTPNAYKASKLHSIVPTNGNGDMTVVRATAATATRVNSSGVVELVGVNVPRLNYDSLGSASILLEPLRTNVLLNSVWAGGGSIPTSWVAAGTNTGISTATTSIKNTNVSAYRFVTSAQRQEFQQSLIAVLNTVTYFSVYVESVVTSVSVDSMLRISGIATGSFVFLKNNLTITNTTLVEAGNTYAIQFNCNVIAGSFSARIGVGCVGSVTGDITLSMPQFEQGVSSSAAYPTSYIPTTTTALTRNADIITRNDIYTNNLITSAGGTLFVELDNNFSLIRDAFSSSIALNTVSNNTGNGLEIRSSTGSGRLQIFKSTAGSGSSIYTTLTDKIKVAIKWNGTIADVFVNGIKVVSATVFTATIMEYLNLQSADVPKYIKSTMLFPTPLTDAEMASLTTL